MKKTHKSKNATDKKPRGQALAIHIPGQHEQISVVVHKNGNVEFYTPEGEKLDAKTNYVMAIPKRNKIKETTRVPLSNPSLTGPYEAIKQGDYLYAVDTNTHIYPKNGYYLAIGVACLFKINKNPDRLDFIENKVFGFELFDKYSGEKIVIAELINSAIERFDLSDDKVLKIYIVTDQLMNIDEHNSRKLPLIEGTNSYLPNGFQLIYASADKKNDNIFTQLIHKCDESAKKILKKQIDELGYPTE